MDLDKMIINFKKTSREKQVALQIREDRKHNLKKKTIITKEKYDEKKNY